MKKFLHDFFGKGTNIEFTNFSLAHIIPILVLVAVILLIGKNRDRIRQSKYEANYRYILAFALILSEMSY